MKNNIVNIDDYRPHEVSELICLKCFHRWIGVYPEYTLLKDLECKCGEVGYVIKTGQTVVSINIRKQHMVLNGKKPCDVYIRQ